MRKVIRVCDGCGVEVHDDEDAVVEVREPNQGTKKYDVCKTCLAEVKKVFYLATAS